MIKKKIGSKGRITIGESLLNEIGVSVGEEVYVALSEDGKELIIAKRMPKSDRKGVQLRSVL